MTRPPRPGVHKLAYSCNEAAESLGVSPSSVRRALRHGQLPFVRLGGRVLIPVSALRRALLEMAQREEP